MGTHEDLEEHLKVCRFEGMKDFLQRVDEKMVDLQLSLNQKDQEIEFLRSMLGKLSERLESLEKSVDMKLGGRLGSKCLEIVNSWVGWGLSNSEWGGGGVAVGGSRGLDIVGRLSNSEQWGGGGA